MDNQGEHALGCMRWKVLRSRTLKLCGGGGSGLRALSSAQPSAAQLLHADSKPKGCS